MRDWLTALEVLWRPRAAFAVFSARRAPLQLLLPAALALNIFYVDLLWNRQVPSFLNRALAYWPALQHAATFFFVLAAFFLGVSLLGCICVHATALALRGTGRFSAFWAASLWVGMVFQYKGLLYGHHLLILEVALRIWEVGLIVIAISEIYALDVGSSIGTLALGAILQIVFFVIVIAAGGVIYAVFHPGSLRRTRHAAALSQTLHTPADLNWMVETLDGHPVQMQDFAGKTMILNRWATWCAPCRAEMASLDGLAQQFKDTPDPVVIAISTEASEKVRAYAAKHPVHFPLYVCRTRWPDAFKTDVYPTTFILSKDGFIVKKIEGARDWTAPAFMADLKRLTVLPSKMPPAMSTLPGLRIPVRQAEDLNFKSKETILDMRRAAVNAQPELAPQAYHPSEAVFGQIIGGKPWWSMDGLYFYANSRQSIEGLSEQSRFILNPYLLVGLREWRAYTGGSKAWNEPSPYVRPLALLWTMTRKHVTASFDVAGRLQFAQRIRSPNANATVLMLIAYNARDLGYAYLAIDTAHCVNTFPVVPAHGPVAIAQYLHLGSNCGYPGGCNNISPDQPELNIRVVAVPAIATVHLWRHKPASAAATPDLTVELRLQ